MVSAIFCPYAHSESCGISEREGTRPGVINNKTASNSVRAEKGYQKCSLFCTLESEKVAVKKASLVTSNTEMTIRT